MRYSISEFPMNNGYKPGLADDRVGYFVTKVYDYDKLDLDGTVVRYINRWYLKKKNPKAKISSQLIQKIIFLRN